MRRRLKIIGPSRLAGRRRLRPVLLMSRKPSVSTKASAGSRRSMSAVITLLGTEDIA